MSTQAVSTGCCASSRKQQLIQEQTREQEEIVARLKASTSPSVLVVGSTGKQGSQVCISLIEKGFKVFGTTRNSLNLSLAKKGVIPVQFSYGNVPSMTAALTVSNAKLVYFMTDLFNIAGGKKEVEIQQGKIIIDCCKAANVEHIVFSSVADCDSCPEAIVHFKTKFVLESHLKSSGIPFTILRPVAFLENYTDPSMMGENPFQTGILKGFWRSDLKVKLVSCVDIGRAVAVAFSAPERWIGQTIDCVSCEVSSNDILPVLSSLAATAPVGNTRIKKTFRFGMAVPAWVIRWFLGDFQAMIDFFDATGYSSDINTFKEMVPNPLGLNEVQYFFYKSYLIDHHSFIV